MLPFVLALIAAVRVFSEPHCLASCFDSAASAFDLALQSVHAPLWDDLLLVEQTVDWLNEGPEGALVMSIRLPSVRTVRLGEVTEPVAPQNWVDSRRIASRHFTNSKN